ncbi:MAG: DUF3332 domain-containing protein [Prevotella sp.]|nr:DUF3332 domain-containing protein [Prevotella sp.]
MKKIKLQVVVAILAGSFLFSSCIGSFSLFNQYQEWQRTMTSNKYVNAIVGFFLMPFAGGISLIIDELVLNTIEFWTGENPIAANTQQVMGQDGKLYTVKTYKNGYKILSPNGDVTKLTYNKKDNSWWISQNGAAKELFRFNDDGKSIKVNVNGTEKDFSLNEQGLKEAKKAAFEGRDLAGI